MNAFYNNIPAVACIVVLIVGIFILSLDPRLARNRLFFLTAFSLVVWSFAEYVMRNTTRAEIGMLAGRIGALGWCFVGAFFVSLCLSLIPSPPSWWRRTYTWLIYLLSIVFVCLTAFTDLIFKDFETGGQKGVHEIPGALRLPSKLWVVALLVLGICLLYSARRRLSSSEERARVEFVMVAAFIPLATGLVTDVIIPLLGFRAPFSTHLATPIMAIVIAIGVTREGLLTTVTGKLGVRVIENLDDAVFLVDPDGMIETVNPSALSLTDRTGEETLGRHIGTIMTNYELSVRAGADEDDGHARRAFILTRGGLAIPVALTSGRVTDRKDRTLGFILVAHDMRKTLRLLDMERQVESVNAEVKAHRETLELLRRSAREMKDASAFLAGVLDNISEPVWIKDRGSRYVYVNPAFTGLTGLGQEKAGGRTSEQLGMEENWSMLDRKPGASHSEGIMVPEFTINDLQGEEHVTRAVTAPILDENGRLEFVVGMLVDTTEEKRLEQSRLDFIRIAAHELRTPLTSLKLGLELFAKLTRSEMDAEEQRSLDILSIAVERLSRLSRNLLDLASMDAGLLKLQRCPVDILSLFSDAALLFEKAARDKGLDLRIEETAAGREVWADPARVSQVLNNLLSNAVKYTDEGAVVMSISTGENGMLEVSVSDTGAGIPPGEQRDIFSRFAKRGKANGGKEGAGLGLSISKTIVEAHGGTITVSSTPGLGSVFTFTLPVEAGSQADERPALGAGA